MCRMRLSIVWVFVRVGRSSACRLRVDVDGKCRRGGELEESQVVDHRKLVLKIE